MVKEQTNASTIAITNRKTGKKGANFHHNFKQNIENHSTNNRIRHSIVTTHLVVSPSLSVNVCAPSYRTAIINWYNDIEASIAIFLPKYAFNSRSFKDSGAFSPNNLVNCLIPYFNNNLKVKRYILKINEKIKIIIFSQKSTNQTKL